MTESRNCPECGRPVALLDRPSCAYCGASLPWAASKVPQAPDATSDEKRIAELLATKPETNQLPPGTTYPAACGACGEKLPQDHPVQCPKCHTAVRDPFTGKLLFETGTDEGFPGRGTTKILVGLLVIGILLLFMVFLLRTMMNLP